MRNFILFVMVTLTLFSCKSDDEGNFKDGDYLIFGHFYGMCVGESCVEMFKLTQDGLYEDANDNYSGSEFDFYQLDQNIFDQVKDLKATFPEQLVLENTEVIGCPDCADGGGLFIQLSRDGHLYTWRIDQVKTNVPEYLHNFVDKVNEKIVLINK